MYCSNICEIDEPSAADATVETSLTHNKFSAEKKELLPNILSIRTCDAFNCFTVVLLLFNSVDKKLILSVNST